MLVSTTSLIIQNNAADLVSHNLRSSPNAQTYVRAINILTNIV